MTEPDDLHLPPSQLPLPGSEQPKQKPLAGAPSPASLATLDEVAASCASVMDEVARMRVSQESQHRMLDQLIKWLAPTWRSAAATL